MIFIACYYPLYAVKDLTSGKVDIVGSFREQYDGMLWNELSPDCTRELKERAIHKWMRGRSGHWNIECTPVPCGKCIGCRLEYSRTWANRNVLESLMHPEGTNWFFTLTIDDDHLVKGREGFATTCLDDLTSFMKRLRTRWAREHGVNAGIRFYGTNEYGDDSMRPHYHVLVFGVPLYDLEFYKTTDAGDVLYKSKELDEIWQHGFVTVAEFNWNTAAYTARYVMKKAIGVDAASYEALGIEPEKPRMSRRPGIAKPFYDVKVSSIYDLDEIVLPATKDGKLRVISPPKYFDKHLERDNPELFEYIKANRERISLLRKEVSEQRQGYDPIELLDNQMKAKEQKLRVFSRQAQF